LAAARIKIAKVSIAYRVDRLRRDADRHRDRPGCGHRRPAQRAALAVGQGRHADRACRIEWLGQQRAGQQADRIQPLEIERLDIAPRPLPVLLDPDLAGPLHHHFGGGRIVEHIPDRGQQVAQRGLAVSHCRAWRIL
jgi:hypothetical protein